MGRGSALRPASKTAGNFGSQSCSPGLGVPFSRRRSATSPALECSHVSIVGGTCWPAYDCNLTHRCFLGSCASPVRTFAVSELQKPLAIIVASYAPSLWNFRTELVQALVRRGFRVAGCAPPHPDASSRLR